MFLCLHAEQAAELLRSYNGICQQEVAKLQQQSNERQQAAAACNQILSGTQAELAVVTDLQAALDKPGQQEAAVEVLQHNLALAR